MAKEYRTQPGPEKALSDAVPNRALATNVSVEARKHIDATWRSPEYYGGISSKIADKDRFNYNSGNTNITAPQEEFEEPFLDNYKKLRSTKAGRSLIEQHSRLLSNCERLGVDQLARARQILVEAETKLRDLLLQGPKSRFEIASAVPELYESRAAAPKVETYKDRPAGESAPDFIERIYGKRLTGEFTRADLRKLDAQAEMGLRNWERKHGRAPLNLPTVEERNDHLLARDPETLSRTERQARTRVSLKRRHP